MRNERTTLGDFRSPAPKLLPGSASFFAFGGILAVLAMMLNLALLAGGAYVVCLILQHFGVI